MSQIFRKKPQQTSGFFAAFLVVVLFNFFALALPYNLLNFYGSPQADRTNLLNFAPEIWLSVLALSFGTLIIVISIAAESTPKLIDLFVEDFRSRFYIWFITLSAFENVFLQLFHTNVTTFFDNMIFINSYVQLPLAIILAIPYVFYILKYTRHSSVIGLIHHGNLRTIRAALKTNSSNSRIRESHFELMENINQLQDLLQYIQFKEPRAEIIVMLGKSLRYYLKVKGRLPDSYFQLTDVVKSDISFKTLVKKFNTIESEKTFYEQKVLRVFGSTYLMLMQEGHYDLASLCGSEFYETGLAAVELKDENSVNTIIIHFNTLIRYGINQGLKSNEVRYVYNTIFHYSRFIEVFIKKHEEARILQCFRYFSNYRNEVHRLADNDPSFVLLTESFALALKNILVVIFEQDFPRDFQANLLKMFNEQHKQSQKAIHNGERLIYIALSLFYMHENEEEFNAATVDQLLKSLHGISPEKIETMIHDDCERISIQSEDFWEETDQGNRNIFYSEHKDQLPAFQHYVFQKLKDK